MSEDRFSLAGQLTREAGPVGTLAVEGSVAYLGRGGVTAVDLGDPASPRALAAVPTQGHIGRLTAAGGRVFAASDRGVEVIDVRRPPAERHLGIVPVGPSVDDIAAAGDLLLVSDREAVHAWRVPADVREARRLGGCRVDLCGRLTLRGDLLFVAADCEGMFVLDVADPSRPARVGLFEGPGDVTRVALDGDRAFLADYTGGVSVVDVSDPRRPRSLGEWDEGIVGDVAARGGLAYLAMGSLVILDATRPARLRPVARRQLRDGDTAWNLELAGDLLCALGGAGLSLWTAPARA
jgi:hypothetical protein